MKRSESYRDHLLNRLKDPEEAVAYLNAEIKEDDSEMHLLALRDVTEARSDVSEIIKKTDLSSENLLSRAVGDPIEYWVKVGKIAKDNPDLTYEAIKGILIGFEEIRTAKLEPYKCPLKD